MVQVTMDLITIGQRVRVIDGSLVPYRQVGTVVAAGTANDWSVHLDDNNERPGVQILFHGEELRAMSEAPAHRRHDS